MSETFTPEPPKRNAQKVDLNVLADAFEKMGDHDQAQKLRDQAQKASQANAEPEITDVAAKALSIADQTPSSVSLSEQRKPPSFHDPKFDAQKFRTTHAIEAIRKALRPANQNESPSPPNAPKGPSPSGGK